MFLKSNTEIYDTLNHEKLWFHNYRNPICHTLHHQISHLLNDSQQIQFCRDVFQ